MMTRRLRENIEWVVVAVILAAYMSVTFGWLSFQHPLYQWSNVLGAGCIMIISYRKRDYQPAVLNLIWCIVALVGVARSLWL